MIGRVFARLTVEKQVPSKPTGARMLPARRYECRCVCGVVRIVRGTDLRTGNTRSCGCLKRKYPLKIRNPPKATKPYLSMNCAVCGTEFMSRWRARDGRYQRCCSTKCGNSLRDISGVKNPNWRDNATLKNLGGRFTNAYQKWRFAVLGRDGGKCVWCGSTDDLHADHIMPWALFPEHRHDVDNGQTLCAPCHRRTQTFGARKKGDAALYAKKRDESEAGIVRELRALGYIVILLDEPVDMLVRHFSWPLNVWVMGECKTSVKGKLKLRKDQQEQQEFCSWHGVPYWTDGLSALTWLQRWPRMETSTDRPARKDLQHPDAGPRGDRYPFGDPQ